MYSVDGMILMILYIFAFLFQVAYHNFTKKIKVNAKKIALYDNFFRIYLNFTKKIKVNAKKIVIKGNYST